MIDLADEHRQQIRQHFPEENIPAGCPGRKPISTRSVLEAVLWILNTGAQWRMLPQCCPNHKIVHRSIDAMFASAKEGGGEIGSTKRAKGVKIMEIVDRHGLPLSVSTHAANHHEVTLVQLSFDLCMIEAKPGNPIGGKAYDSDPLDKELGEAGVEMIASHRKSRKKHKTRDGRHLRRWLVERFFAWLQWATPGADQMGILRRKPLGFCPTCMPLHPATAILR